jgi:hypothetical protein
MISLTDYIFEEEQKIAARNKATVDRIKEFYPIFNERYFNNELPDRINFYCHVESKETYLACQGFERPFYVSNDHMEGDMYRMYYKSTGQRAIRKGKGWQWVPIVDEATKIDDCTILRPYILFNTKFELSDKEFEDTLIHEMVHLWVSRNGLEPKRAHGKEFTSKCNEIRKIAKKKYNTEYFLTTKAEHVEEYGLSKEAEEKLKSSIVQSVAGKGLLSVYIEFDEDTTIQWHQDDSRRQIIFCTKNVLKKIWSNITDNNTYDDFKVVKISTSGYENLCNKIGQKLKRVTTYRYYRLDQFKDFGKLEDFIDILSKDTIDPKELGLVYKTQDKVSEAKEETNKKEGEDMEGMIQVTGPVGNMDLGEIVDKVEDIIDKEENNSEGNKPSKLKLYDGNK